MKTLEDQVAEQQAEIERLSRGIAVLAQQFEMLREEYNSMHQIAVLFAAQTNNDLDALGQRINLMLPHFDLPLLVRDSPH